MPIYAPRPEYMIKPDSLFKYDTGEYVGEPKFDGSCGVLVTGKDGEHKLYDRAEGGVQTELTRIGKLDLTELAKVHYDSIIICEYMNKYKLNENGEKWVDKIVIYDILKHKGDSFVGYTKRQRREFLIGIFGNIEMYVNEQGDISRQVSKHPYCIETDFAGVYLIKCYYGKFRDVFSELTKIPMIEGLVLKRLSAPLEPAYTEKNNTLWQVKCRKPKAKIYPF